MDELEISLKLSGPSNTRDFLENNCSRFVKETHSPTIKNNYLYYKSSSNIRNIDNIQLNEDN